MHIFATMFEKEIKEYERVREVYQKKVAERMNRSDRQDYILSLKQIREEGTDEYLVAFFFRVAISRMNDELLQKESNSRHIFLKKKKKSSDRG